MPSLAELMKQNLKDQENSKTQPEEEIIPEIEKMNGVTKASKSILTPKIKTCPICDKRNKISGEKSMNKQEIILWFQNFLSENENSLPLDWLRGQKLTFESVNEMRK